MFVWLTFNSVCLEPQSTSGICCQSTQTVAGPVGDVATKESHKRNKFIVSQGITSGGYKLIHGSCNINEVIELIDPSFNIWYDSTKNWPDCVGSTW